MNDKHITNLPNPFPGLRPFQSNESHLFFGREGQSETIVSYLAKYRFAAVTGASGSGKSSLMYCGIIPLLYGGFIQEAGTNWKIITTRPGSSPIWNLANTLVENDENKGSDSDIADLKEYFYSLLNRHSEGLYDALKQICSDKNQNILIVVDQFEELFRYKESREKSKKYLDDPKSYIKLLVNIINQSKLPVYVVLTMRSDFIGHCSDYQDLTRLINKSNYLVPQMTRNDFEKVILGPLRVVNVDMDPRLLQEILNTIEKNSDQLPVLQHALMRTWDFWIKSNSPGRTISMRDYMAAGKLGNALSLHANEAYNKLSEHDRNLCKVIFKAITEKGLEGKGIRRPAAISEISEITMARPADIYRIVDLFRDPERSFLTPGQEIKLTPESVIDITHESLMRIWDKLSAWVDEESMSAQTYLRLIELANQYQMGKTGLLKNPDLQLSINWRKSQNPNRAWSKRYNPAFEKAIVYLNTSEKVFLQEEETKIKLQRRELKRTRKIAILLGFVAIAFLGLMFYAYRQSQEALAQKERAESYANIVEGEKNQVLEQSKVQQLALIKEREKLDSLKKERQTQILVNPEKDKAYQELIEEVSKRTEELEETAELFKKEKQRTEELERTAKIEKSKAENLTRAELRKRMLVVASAIAVKSTKISDKQLAGLLAYHAYSINKANGGQNNQPDIYTALYNSLRLFKNRTYNTLKGHNNPINTLAFDPSRNLLYSADDDGTILRWGLINSSPRPVQIVNNSSDISTMDITKDGRWLAYGTDVGEIFILNTQLPNQPPRRIVAHAGKILNIQFIPGKNALISMGSDKKINYWDLLTDEGYEVIKDNSGFAKIITHPTGKNIICITLSGKVINWNIASVKEKVLYSHTTTLHAAAYDYEGEKIAVGDRNGRILILNAESGKVLKTYRAHNSRVLDLSFSPDNKLLASSALDGVIKIWNIQSTNDLPVEIRENESWANTLAFSPDGKKLLTSSNNGNYIYQWPVESDEMADEICNYIDRQLTVSEWNSYVGEDIPYETACSK